MFLGIGNLDERTLERLRGFATVDTEQEIYMSAVSSRAAETMRVGTRLLIGAISEATDQPTGGQDSQHKQASRLWSAGVLHLVGTHAANVGHVESAEITLARSVRVSAGSGAKQPTLDRQYSRVTAKLDNVDVSADAAVGFRREFDARSCTPTQLLEAATILKVYATDQTPRTGSGSPIERSAAWIGVSEMPSTYHGGVERLGDPERVAQVARQMLQAVLDPGLNPEIQTYEQVVAVSPELADQVLDLQRPLSDIEFSLMVPEWAKVGIRA